MANKNVKKENKMEQSQENESNSQEVAELGVAGAEMFLKHEAAVKDAKQFYQCSLPAISYYSKRTLCEAIDNMKRLISHSKDTASLEMCVEMLEKAIAYLYNRKVNG